MKDQYAGDINDFHKYGLLRALILPGGIRCGVWWMLTPDDGRSDGALVGYLARPARYAVLDPELFGLMGTLVENGRRSVAAVEGSEILPGAAFDAAMVPVAAEARHCAFQKTLARFPDADLVFFDPDMGIEVPSIRHGSLRSRQYVYWSEIVETVDRDHSALVFQYFPRRPRRDFIGHTLEEFACRVPTASLSATWTPRVAFFLAATPAHAALGSRLDSFSHSWGLPVMHRPAQTRQPSVENSERRVAAVSLQPRALGDPACTL
ncbi:hypothetical protein JXA88_05445 [Candidatus Fermentibacteria bacterium]|nr:hypothetical protein [Candidatus Fermentibacteria bacterium]